MSSKVAIAFTLALTCILLTYCSEHKDPLPKEGPCLEQTTEWTGWGIRVRCPHVEHIWVPQDGYCRCQRPGH